MKRNEDLSKNGEYSKKHLKNHKDQIEVLKETLKQKEKKLEKYENLILELNNEDFSKENTEKSIKESVDYINRLYSILAKYKKITKKPALDQLKHVKSRYIKGIEANKESIIEFRTASQKLDRLMRKYKNTNFDIKFAKENIKNAIQVLKKETVFLKDDLNRKKDLNRKQEFAHIKESFIEEYNGCVTYFVNYNDKLLQKKQNEYRILSEQQKSRATSVALQAQSLQENSEEFITIQKNKIFDEIENKITPLLQKTEKLIAKDYKLIKPENSFSTFTTDITPLKEPIRKAYNAGKKRAEEYSKNAQAIHDQEIKTRKEQIKKEIIKSKADFEKEIKEDDPEIKKLKRYKLALEHMNSHKDRFSFFAVDYGDYPGKQN